MRPYLRILILTAVVVSGFALAQWQRPGSSGSGVTTYINPNAVDAGYVMFSGSAQGPHAQLGSFDAGSGRVAGSFEVSHEQAGSVDGGVIRATALGATTIVSGQSSGSVGMSLATSGAYFKWGAVTTCSWSDSNGIFRLGNCSGTDNGQIYARLFGGSSNPVALGNQTNITTAGRSGVQLAYLVSDNGSAGTPSVGALVNQQSLGSYTNAHYVLLAKHVPDSNGVGGTFIWGVRGETARLGMLVFPTTDSTGSPGAATISTVSGKAAIASGASSVVITSGATSATSSVFITPIDLDATCINLVAAEGSGSFTVTCAANATATTKFKFLVVNP
jgi:hypothetical protein